MCLAPGRSRADGCELLRELGKRVRLPQHCEAGVGRVLGRRRPPRFTTAVEARSISPHCSRSLATPLGALLVGLFSLLSAPAYPWGSKGHEIAAAIAETHLNDTARKRIKELLPQGTTLADASTWPDKAGRQIPDMDPYHFINFPKDANSYEQQRDCKLRNCIIEAIAWYLSVLKSPNAPRNEKRTALRFIAHLVGDIHQPLHAGFGEDRGGNSVDVRFNGRKENLHSLWDTALVELEEGTPAEVAARIESAVTDEERNQWQGGTPEQWTLESLAVVRSRVYLLPASREVKATYIEKARAVIRTRLVQAGARLASMLNETLR
jgi:nuclease S1